jgi:hypothetical protein
MTNHTRNIVLLLFLLWGSNCFAAILSESDIKVLATEIEQRSNGTFESHAEGRTIVIETFMFDNSYLKGLTKENIANSLEDELVVLCATNFINVRYDIHYIDNAGIERKKKVYLGLSDFLNYNSDTRERISLKDHPKSNGVNMSLLKPRGWIVQEGERPHIVQHFLSHDKLTRYMIQINPMPTFISKRESKEWLDTEDVVNGWITEGLGSTACNIKILTMTNEVIDSYPAKKATISYSISRNGLDLDLFSAIWWIIYEDSLITLWGVKTFPENEDEMKKCELLFSLITNNILFPDHYIDYSYE